MDLSVIIVSYNVAGYLLDCLESILGQPSRLQYEVIVVDNASADGTVEKVRQAFPQVQLIANPDNPGLSRATNQALRQATGRYVLYLNPDTRVGPGALDRLVAFADAHPDASLFGCRLLNPDGSLQAPCYRFPTLRMTLFTFFPWVPIDSPANGRYPRECYDRVFEPEHILGAALTVRRQAVDALGGWSEDFFLYFEETDFCYRANKAGYKSLYCPDAWVIHHGDCSTSQTPDRMRLQFYRSESLFYARNYPLYRRIALRGIRWLGLSYWVVRDVSRLLRGQLGVRELARQAVLYARILVQ